MKFLSPIFLFGFVLVLCAAPRAISCDFDLEENLSILNSGKYSPIVNGFAKSIHSKKKYDFVSRKAFQKAKRTMFMTYSAPTSFGDGYIEATIVEIKDKSAPSQTFSRRLNIAKPIEDSTEQVQQFFEELPSCSTVEQASAGYQFAQN